MAFIEEDIGEILRRKRMTLGAVESATGGLVSSRITDVPGSSDYFHGSVTAYSNEMKAQVVGVRWETIERYGAVSAQVAEEMAEGGRKLLAADICISDTGIAGPAGATEGKAVGLFYLGLAYGGRAYSRQHNFKGDRRQNKRDAAESVLKWLKEYLSALD
jgi:PncC family amidohydrolase